jgi:hypothetical protein
MGHQFLKLFIAGVSLVAATASYAGTVYEHNGPGSFYYQTAAEYGDEIVLAGSDRVITAFQFEYFANYDLAKGLTFRLYTQNDLASGGKPGALIDSRQLDIKKALPGTGGYVVDLDFGYDPSNILPGRLTYTVEFAGLTPGNEAGLIAPGGTPVIGLSNSDFWEKTGPGADDWALKVISGGITGNFVTKVTAVPEPGTVALMAAGVGLLVVAARRK